MKCHHLCSFQALRVPFSSIRFLTTSPVHGSKHYKLLILGGGSGGISVAAKFRSKFGKNEIAVIEPSDVHYYQPYWTLVGGGLKTVSSSKKFTASLIPKGVKWIQDKVIAFDPKNNTVQVGSGTEVKYDYLVVALGIRLAFEKIKGLPEAFETPGVCSNYSVLTVEKTAKAIMDFKSGNAIFTQPTNPIKCAGAPQKIMYLAEEKFKKLGKRDKANIIFNTALPTIFSAPKYAAALRAVAQSKNISVNYGHNLVEVRPQSKEAIFEKLSDGNETVVLKYEMLHITPPMVSPESIGKSPLADPSGFLKVNKQTLQHESYSNIFGIGDCTNVPTSKTAAAVAGQLGVLCRNLNAVMNGKQPLPEYKGYTSCPLVTGHSKGILAEFDFDLQPVETLPIDQGKERWLFYFVKKEILPIVYWNLMLKGYWEGPGIVRKLLHLGLSK